MKINLDGKKLIIILFIALVIFGILSLTAPEIIYTDTIVSTVTDKNIKRYGDEDWYMIYTVGKEGEAYVFKNTDNPYLLKFNSSDIYATIEVFETYKFYVRGIRIPILSSYQNIYKIEKEDK